MSIIELLFGDAIKYVRDNQVVFEGFATNYALIINNFDKQEKAAFTITVNKKAMGGDVIAYSTGKIGLGYNDKELEDFLKTMKARCPNDLIGYAEEILEKNTLDCRI